MTKIYKYDFIVIGSGIAGLTFALKVAKHGTVAIVTKKEDRESNTNYAQGGIASVLSNTDSIDSHFSDTLIAGAGLCHEDAVHTMVTEGKSCIDELIKFGVEFSKNEAGVLELGMEGGHSQNRIIHAKDFTGKEIERALINATKQNESISVFENHIAIDLLVSEETTGEKTCEGVWVFDSKTEIKKLFTGKCVMLCSGGVGNVFQHTTNPAIATGDGIAMAYRAGAKVANMEFVQFHPTSLYAPNANSFLISEAMRGFGGVLKLKDGSTFMEKYHPLKSLAPRDIVARAIEKEMKLNNEPCVYLDVTPLDNEKLKKEFPNIYNQCLKFGIDITKEMIPVVPAAHYMCGGIMTDKNAHTSIKRLYASGECACTGVHGANRLASNSLLEAVVYSRNAASDVVLLEDNLLEVSSSFENDLAKEIIEVTVTNSSAFLLKEKLLEIKSTIQKTMTQYVGIVRSNIGLQTALYKISILKNEVDGIFKTNPLSYETIELRHLAQTAKLIVEFAIQRKESRGLHYNVDYPETVDEWKHDSVFENLKKNK